MADFETLLNELGEVLGTPLEPDDKGSCLIEFENGIDLQMEMAPRGFELRLLIRIGELPLGRYREDVFVAALKANGAPHPRFGVFAFIDEINELVLSDQIFSADLRGTELHEYLEHFMAKALRWKESLENGQIPNEMGGVAAQHTEYMHVRSKTKAEVTSCHRKARRR